MQKKEKDKNMLGNMLNKTFYSAGVVCSKTRKLKDAVNWKKVSASATKVWTNTQEQAEKVGQEVKNGVTSVQGSFKAGYESVKGEADPWTEKISGRKTTEDEGDKIETKEPEERAVEPETETKGSGVVAKSVFSAPKERISKSKRSKKRLESSRKKAGLPKKKQEVDEFSEGTLASDLEKEIEKIDQEVAEI